MFNDSLLVLIVDNVPLICNIIGMWSDILSMQSIGLYWRKAHDRLDITMKWSVNETVLLIPVNE